jgi:hypothetical protein
MIASIGHRRSKHPQHCPCTQRSIVGRFLGWPCKSRLQLQILEILNPSVSLGNKSFSLSFCTTTKLARSAVNPSIRSLLHLNHDGTHIAMARFLIGLKDFGISKSLKLTSCTPPSFPHNVFLPVLPFISSEIPPRLKIDKRGSRSTSSLLQKLAPSYMSIH